MTLKDLKSGDKVVVRTRNDRFIDTVKNITPSGNIRIMSGTLYDSDGSQKTSDVWNVNHLEVWTEEKEREIKEEHFTRKTLKMMQSTRSITYTQALKIAAILINEEV